MIKIKLPAVPTNSVNTHYQEKIIDKDGLTFEIIKSKQSAIAYIYSWFWNHSFPIATSFKWDLQEYKENKELYAEVMQEWKDNMDNEISADYESTFVMFNDNTYYTLEECTYEELVDVWKKVRNVECIINENEGTTVVYNAYIYCDNADEPDEDHFWRAIEEPPFDILEMTDYDWEDVHGTQIQQLYDDQYSSDWY